MKRNFLAILFYLFLVLILASCNKTNVLEEKIIIKTDEYRMNGILTLPKENGSSFPVVILIGGSGPTDMNSTVGKIKPFRDLAHGLAEKGIASLRYNKRTFEYQKELVNDFYFSPEDEYINDALNAIDLMHNDLRIDKNNIFLVGHSMGGQFVPIIANLTNKVKGVIIMAGTTFHILDVLMEQIEILGDDKTYNEYLQYYEIAKNISAPDTEKASTFYFGAYYHYWVEYNKLDFESELITCAENHPMLIMNAEDDVQVTLKHYQKYIELLSSNENEHLIKFSTFPNLDHFFVDGNPQGFLSKIFKPKHIDKVVIEDISKFISL